MYRTYPYPLSFIARCLVWCGLVLCLCCPVAATARQPIEAPAWFIQSVVADPVALPSGLRLRQTNEGFELVNLAATPVYVLSPVAGAIDADPPLPMDPPAGLHASHKLLDGHAFLWLMGDQPQQWDWFTSQDSTAFHLFPSSLMQYAPTIAQSIRRGDDRPPNVPIPVPQPATLTLMDEERVIQLPFTLQHALNPNYDQEVQVYREILAQRQWQQYRFDIAITLVMLLLVLLGVGLGIALLVIVVHKLTYRPGPTRR